MNQKPKLKKKTNPIKKEKLDDLNLNDEDIEELVRSAEDFRTIINDQKNEINLLKKEINTKTKAHIVIKDK